MERCLNNDKIEFGKFKGNLCRWEVKFDNWEGKYFGKWEEEYFCNWGKVYFDNQLVYNEPRKNSWKVENDLGMMMISLDSSSPHKRQQTHLLFSIQQT